MLTPRRGQLLYFSDDGGPLAWDQATTADWSSTSGGPYNQLWSDGASAQFEGTPGTVNVAGTIASVNSISFNVDGYTLAGGTITLTGSASITAGVVGLSDTIGSTIAGSVGLSKNGAGILVLSGANTYSGLTSINLGALTLSGDNTALTGGFEVGAGTLNVNSATALGTGMLTIDVGGTLNNTSGSPLALALDRAGDLNGNFAFSTAAGTAKNSLTLGAGPVSLPGDLTITLNGGGCWLSAAF